MKKILLFVFALIAFSRCSENDPEAIAELSPVVGKWRLTAYGAGDSLIFVSTVQSQVTIIRPDGIMVDEEGVQGCCPPTRYLFNGVEITPKPAAPVKSADCSLVLCAPCGEMKITTPMSDPDVMVIECDGRSMWYKREQ